MKIYNTIKEIRDEIKALRKEGKKVGFVPTMGALHEGHLSLIKKARKENAIVVLSIFVNPIQFSANEDYNKYPRTFQEDCILAKEAGIDVVFAPSIEDMYPSRPITFVNVLKISNRLCGERRIGHFHGVATVVSKLLNIVQCDRIYLGQKDYQQFLIIKQMIQDLNFDVEPVLCSIVREKDGLAMSSRNKYLTEQDRADAICLFEALEAAKALIIEQKIQSTSDIVYILRLMIEKKPSAKIDYIFIGDAETLEEIETLKIGSQILVALAVFIGDTRLIDNYLLFL